MKLLVTGGAGFIGSNFIRYYLETHPDDQIVNLDKLTYAGHIESTLDFADNPNYKFIKGDIVKENDTEEAMAGVDIVVHFAAESHVDRSVLNPLEFVKTNVLGTAQLLQTALKNKIKRFHHISTDEVFGSLAPGEPAWNEETPYAPNSPYAASKASSDHLVRSYGHTYGLPYSLTNCSNNYGPYHFPEKLIPLIILSALDEKPLPVYGDGQQIRDWLHVEDHCRAIYLVLTKGANGSSYNIGGDNQPANLTIVETICDIFEERKPRANGRSYRELIQFVKDRPGHDRRYAMDSSKIQRELGWSPRHTLTDGLRNTIDWYLANPDWVLAIRKQQEYQSWLTKNYDTREKA